MDRFPPPHAADRLERRILAAVEGTVRQHRMLSPGDAVLMGVSGGPDSMALLHLMLRLAPLFSLRLGVAHLDHGLRDRAGARDAAFVSRAAGSLGLPCFLEKADTAAYRRRHRLSPEEAARRVRYRFFSRTAAREGFSKVAVGHQADDNAELVLMNLLRGSGPGGLSGIPPVRRLPGESAPGGRTAPPAAVVRPLIRLTRGDILAYLACRGIDHVADESNADPAYLRNRLRHELIPHLRAAYNPRIVAALNRLAAILRAEEDWAEGAARDAFTGLTAPPGGAGGVAFPADALRRLHPALCARVIRRALAAVKGDLRRISCDHVTAVRGLLEGVGGGRLDLPCGIQAVREGGTLRIRPRAFPPEAPCFDYRVPRPQGAALWVTIAETGDRLRFDPAGLPGPGEILRAGERVAYFDIDRLRFPLVVRNFRPGDRFTPLGTAGTQKVKKYFIDARVPRDLRPRCPLLVSGGEIAWIAGRRRGACARVTPATRRALRAELFLA